MFRLVAVLALVCTVWSQEERCCVTDVWEGEIHVHAGYVQNGTAKMAFNLDFVAYDYMTKETAYYHEAHYPDGTSKSFRMIENHTTKKSYYIEDDECRVQDLTGEMEKDCVPETAQFAGPIYYGAGEHVLHGDAWVMIHKSSEGVETGRELFTVTRNDCIPMETTGFHYFNVGNSYMTGGTYANVRPEITDREMFVPPENCMARAFPKDLENLAAYNMYKNPIP